MHPFIGADEFLYGIERWILYLDGAPPADIRTMPTVKERIAAVRQFRHEEQKPRHAKARRNAHTFPCDGCSR